MRTLFAFARREAVLTISFCCALLSMLAVPPDAGYADYIDLRVLCLLFCLMAVVAGLQQCGLFALLAQRLLSGRRPLGEPLAQDLTLLAHAEYEKKWIGYCVRYTFLEKPLGPRRAGEMSCKTGQ